MNIDELTPYDLECAVTTHVMQWKSGGAGSWYRPGSTTPTPAPLNCVIDANATREMETEIQRRGLVNEYTIELVDLCQRDSSFDFWYDPTYDVAFAMATASPADRCRAALRVVLGRDTM